MKVAKIWRGLVATVIGLVMAITSLAGAPASAAQADEGDWWSAVYSKCSYLKLEKCSTWISMNVATGSRFSCFGDSCAVQPNSAAEAAQVGLWSHLVPGADHANESATAVAGYEYAIGYLQLLIEDLKNGTAIEQRYYAAALARVKANLTHARNWASGAEPPPNNNPPPTPPAATKSFRTVVPPKVSGTAKVGKTLKATSNVSRWSPRPTSVKRQWKRNGVAINGATKTSYRLVGLDKGKKITVTVTGYKAGYTTKSRTSKATKSVKAGTMSKGKVKPIGTTKVGRVLTAKTTKWSKGVKFGYRWYRNGKVIAGASAKTYTLTAADRGKKTKVKVTAAKIGYKSESRMSKSTHKVGWGKLSSATPVITGKTELSQVLVARPGVWKPSTTKFAYQWYCGNRSIRGATHSFLRLTSGELNCRVSVRVTGRASGYKPTSRMSAATTKVVIPAPTPPAPPVITPPPTPGG